MYKQKVDISGVNTSELPVLSNEEMMALFKQIQKGQAVEEARNQLANGNLRLVLSIMKRFNHRGENADDLFQVGCIGLMKAIDNFDLKHKVRFSTYAVPMIVGEIKRHLRDNNPLRVSRSLRDIAYKAMRTREEIIHKTQKEPSLKQIARKLDMPLEQMTFALEAVQQPVSLFEPIYEDGGEPIYVMDQVQDTKEDVSFWDDQLSIKEGLLALSSREKMIVQKRFYIGKTQMEVAEEIGISQAQVSRLEKAAIKRMNDSMFS